MNRHLRNTTAEHFIVVTLNHNTLSLQELPQYSIPCEEIGDFLVQLQSNPDIDEIVGLTTCNRIEFYASVYSVKDAAHVLAKKIAEQTGCRLESLMEKCDVLVDGDAVEHLMRLVSGLDSMVIGDAQILGQVKAAFQQAVSLGTVKKTFHALFQKAFSIAKRVRKETGLGKGRISVSALAVEYAESFFGSLCDVTATVIGAGKMGTLAAKYLKDSGVKELRIVNRSLDRSLELAEKVEAKVYGMDELDRVLAESDLIVSGTAAPEYIITREKLEQVRRNNNTLLLLDIALPPDVDPAVEEVAGVSLVNMESLRRKAQENLAERNSQLLRAQEILDEELDQLGPWPLPLHVESLAKQMGVYANQISQEETQRLFALLPDLTPQQKEVIETQMLRLSERMILAPRRNLRKISKTRTCPDAFRCLADLFDHDCGSRTPLAAESAEEVEVRK